MNATRLRHPAFGVVMSALAAAWGACPAAIAGGACPADLNGDGVVGAADLALLLGSWGMGGAADLDGSGVVNAADLALMLGSWGPCPAAEVRLIEPGTLHSPPAAVGDGGPYISDFGMSRVRGVYLFSGEFHHEAMDLTVPGRGFDFVWARKYRSRIGPDGDFGPGWDCSYDISVRSVGAALSVRDGNGRDDLYTLQPDGTWAAPELFRALSENPDGSLSLHFAHGGRWVFRALDGAPGEGKIASIVDRNDNTMTFEYDPLGRLHMVRDTLHVMFNPREYVIVRNAAGKVTSITDWAGRTVAYEYYVLGEPGGNPGDLKSVATPAVVGTPHGNDFPVGKTTTYTYSTGFADDRLNHNLLTITDPKGQTWLTNTYAPTLDPASPNFDRVRRQTMASGGGGGAAGFIDIAYAPQQPTPDNGNAVVKAIVNDRAGNVAEYSYDSENRLVLAREFTGRALSDVPTNEVNNRPMNPLRADDPPFFETRCEYNADALLTRCVRANGSETLYTYEGGPGVDRRGHANVMQILGLAGPLGGDQPAITLLFDWDFLTDVVVLASETDARGHVTMHEYDARGNRTRTIHRVPSIVEEWTYNPFGQMTTRRWPANGDGLRRLDEFVYYDGPGAGHQHGYLERKILDRGEAGDPGIEITTTYEYDCLGRVTRVIDPRGRDDLYLHNELDQVVRHQSRPYDDLVGVRFETLVFYDANDNVVRTDVENRDETGALQPNTHLTTTLDYDALDRLTSRTSEVDGPDVVTEEYEYDANDNRTLVRSGEAVAGGDPNNVVRTLYDERDLVFRIIRGEGAPEQSTDQYDYSPTGLTRRVVRAGDDPTPATHTWSHDGYDRATSVVDAMGNEALSTYDANGNVLSTRLEGELEDVAGSAGNVRLAESSSQYDEMDRIGHHQNAWFDPITQMPIDDGAQSTLYFWNDLSLIDRIIDDRGNEIVVRGYDRMHRLTRGRRASLYETTFAYDENSNLVRVDDTDFSSGGLAPQQFQTMYEYDGLDRLTRSTNSAGASSTWAYDSRSNVVRGTDGAGHQSLYVYDGLDRLLRTVRDMDGDGAESPADVRGVCEWDDGSRVRRTFDAQGNVTEHEYDSLNRRRRQIRADATLHRFTYDGRDNCVERIDPNGSVHSFTYDGLDRCVAQQAIPAPGVFPSPIDRLFAYDGASRLVRAQEGPSIVERRHDSLHRCTGETQDGVAVSSVYDGVGNRLSLVYPGGLALEHVYDEADRLRALTDGVAPFLMIEYIGDRASQLTHGNGVSTAIEWSGALGAPPPPGDQSDRRIAAVRHSFPDLTTLDHRAFTWDGAGRKGGASIDFGPVQPPRTLNYSHDAFDRLTRAQVFEGPVPVRDTEYVLDLAGNRIQTLGLGTPCAGAWTMSPALPEPADRQMNQYTNTPCDTRQYDRSGNLVQRAPAGPGVVYEYDALDRLVGVRPSPPGSPRIVAYTYDALDRRIVRTDDPDGPAAQSTRFSYDGERVIEEQPDAGAERTIVWPHILDAKEPCAVTGPLGTFHIHRDDLGSAVAATDSNGALVERYWYDDYGRVMITDPAGAPLPVSLAGNPYLFHGMRLDDETRLYHLDGRNSYDPNAGRFVNGNTESLDMGWWGKCHRLALSGHSVGSGVWGDNNGEFSLSTFAMCSPATNREVKRMGGKIALCQRDGTPIIEWTFEKGWPSAADGPGGGGGGGGGGGCGGDDRRGMTSSKAFVDWVQKAANGRYGRVKVQFHWDRERRSGGFITANEEVWNFPDYSGSSVILKEIKVKGTIKASHGDEPGTLKNVIKHRAAGGGGGGGGGEGGGEPTCPDGVCGIDVREMTTGLDVDYGISGGGGGGGAGGLFGRQNAGASASTQWWMNASRGNNIRKSISVICLKRDGGPARMMAGTVAAGAFGGPAAASAVSSLRGLPGAALGDGASPDHRGKFQTLSNVLKAKHDAAMAAIQNTR